jgi:hypothetical protein
MGEDTYVLHMAANHHRSHHSSTHSHSRYPGIAFLLSSDHRNSPGSDPWQCKAHKDPHGKSHHKDGDSPCEAENMFDRTSVEADREAAWDQLLSHTNRCSW